MSAPDSLMLCAGRPHSGQGSRVPRERQRDFMVIFRTWILLAFSYFRT